MKLRPQNQTPGLEPKEVIHYTKNEPAGQPAYYTCVYGNGVVLGSIEMDVDGFYVFFPKLRGGFWDASVLHDIVRKLDALNAAWEIKLNEAMAGQAFMDHPGFTD